MVSPLVGHCQNKSRKRNSVCFEILVREVSTAEIPPDTQKRRRSLCSEASFQVEVAQHKVPDSSMAAPWSLGRLQSEGCILKHVSMMGAFPGGIFPSFSVCDFSAGLCGISVKNFRYIVILLKV